VARTRIGKEDESERPIGKPTFEEKTLQRSVVMLLEVVLAVLACIIPTTSLSIRFLGSYPVITMNKTSGHKFNHLSISGFIGMVFA
jgi:hypothetical protein